MPGRHAGPAMVERGRGRARAIDEVLFSHPRVRFPRRPSVVFVCPGQCCDVTSHLTPLRPAPAAHCAPIDPRRRHPRPRRRRRYTNTTILLIAAARRYHNIAAARRSHRGTWSFIFHPRHYLTPSPSSSSSLYFIDCHRLCIHACLTSTLSPSSSSSSLYF
jgi:hypothetical protein